MKYILLWKYEVLPSLRPQISILALIILISLPGEPARAQLFPEDYGHTYDTTYILKYKDELTTRIFLSRKQNAYVLSERLFSPWVLYRTNDQYQIGVGYTYSFLTLNLAFKLPNINNDPERYGESQYLDLQSHTIFRNLMMDLYLQWNKGYYLANPENIHGLPDIEAGFPLRGDLRTTVIGLNIQHLFNSERYSYKASFVQNEFQKRSAGSPILGVEGYWMLGMADSMIIPSALVGHDFAGGKDFNQADLFQVGINAGYAYTFVVKEMFYLSLSSCWGLAAGTCILNSTTTSDLNKSGLSLGIENHNRISMGFNKNNFYIGVSWIQFNMHQNYGYQDGWFRYSSGNFRLNLVRRFKLKRSIRILRPDLWIF